MKVPDPPIRSYLYVPGSDPRRIEKALASEADAVVLDLEDAVAPNRKEEARETVAGFLRSGHEKPIFVRVNVPGSALAEEDIEAVAESNLAGLRAPKTESAEAVRRVAKRLEDLRCEAGIQCLIESALGLELVFEIARAHERVVGMSLGEADLAAPEQATVTLVPATSASAMMRGSSTPARGWWSPRGPPGCRGRCRACTQTCAMRKGSGAPPRRARTRGS